MDSGYQVMHKGHGGDKDHRLGGSVVSFACSINFLGLLSGVWLTPDLLLAWWGLVRLTLSDLNDGNYGEQ